MARPVGRRPGAAALPSLIRPQLTELVDVAPDGPGWLHEIKFDGYRMHARLDRGSVRLLTRTGLDWTQKYPLIAEALTAVPASQAYLDGELCGVRPDGTTSFDMIQAASVPGNAAALVFFLFDLLFLDGEDLMPAPLRERKARLQQLLAGVTGPLQYSDHQTGHGPEFYAKACEMGVEGIVSKRADAPYAPGNRGLWLKTKCLNREEFVVVGWCRLTGRPRAAVVSPTTASPDWLPSVPRNRSHSRRATADRHLLRPCRIRRCRPVSAVRRPWRRGRAS